MYTRFELPAEVNIYSVLDTRDTLLAWVSAQTGQGASHLAISARDVVEVDGAGLQLLAALGATEQRWHLVESSPVFSEACRTMGFGNWLAPHPRNTRKVKVAIR